MSASRRILRNVLFNWAGYAANVVIAFFLTPFVIESLGDRSYGIWAVLISLTGYYGLLDLGVRGALTQYVARYLAKGDLGAANRTVSTSLVLLAAAGVLVLMATGVVVVFLPRWLQVGSDGIADARIAAVLLGCQFALTPMMAVFSSLIYARERIDLNNMVGITSRIVTAGLVVWALRSGHGLVGLAGSHLAVSVVSWVANYRISRHLLPDLDISRRLFSRASMREIAGYGFFSFVARASGQIIENTDVLVVGLVLADTRAVTYYAVGAALVPYFRELLASVTRTFLPHMISLDARRDWQRLRGILLAGTRWSFFVAAVIAGGLFFAGEDFLVLWVGERFLAGTVYTSSGVILSVLAVAMLGRMLQYCGAQLLLATREVRFLAFLGTGEAVANLVLSVILIHQFGLLGVAIGSLIPALVSQLYLEPRFVLRKLELRWVEFLRSVLPGGLVALGTMALVSWTVSDSLLVETWSDFFRKVCVLAVPSVLVGASASLTGVELRWLKTRLAGRVRG